MKELDRPRYKIIGEMSPFDERDNVHARRELDPDTPEWKKYYQDHAEWEEEDLKTKLLPGVGNVGHPWDLQMLRSQVQIRSTLGRNDFVDGPVSQEKMGIDPIRASEKVKGLARHLGADLVRIGPLNQAHVYSHVGKTKHSPDKIKGASISLPHKNAISIALETDIDLIKTGPVLPELLEIVRVYSQLARISVVLAAYIRSLGFPARAHNSHNYQVLCIPIAIDAGMGELSRMGALITKELGPCLKLATITTDLPLAFNPPVDIGVEEFCQDCKICAKNCPSGAISHGGKVVVRGVEKWKIKPEACYRIWNETGTDCGICIATCPWTKPRTMFHNLCKEIATRKHKAGLWMSIGEELLYGKFRPKPAPDWMETPDLSVWEKYKKLREHI
jgi:ferredoxin